ncbi:MAG: hypothetical protein IJX63_14995 [Lachnospiraceae bacterium]|nr:hypothetical protein [Lachnospiraceae bacterium]
MKKRLYGVGIAISLIIGLSGCGSQIPEMTEEEQAAISEYAVELLLKYDSNQSSRLVDLEPEEEPEPTARPSVTEPPSATEAPIEDSTGMDDVEETPVIGADDEGVGESGDIKTVLGLAESISFMYEDYQTTPQYVDTVNKDLVLEAEDGKQLLVCNFVLVNDGADKQSVDMLLDKIKYVFLIDEESVNAQVTMLSNDLATYMGILDADEARRVVLLAECEEAKLAEAEVIFLQVQKNKETATIQIK